jgi:predicted HAD superfamily Cof-like phosphohydrolase
MTNKEFTPGATYSDKRGNQWKITGNDNVGCFPLLAICTESVGRLDWEGFSESFTLLGGYQEDEPSDFDLVWRCQSEYALTEFKRKIDLFNCIAGKDGVPSDQDIENQVKLIREETKELSEAHCFEEPEINLLQESLDVLVVTFGLLQMLKNKGYDVDKAMGKVVDCNLSKFTQSGVIAAESASKYKQNNEQVEFSYNTENDIWVLKDSSNKIRKPLGFKKVNLEDCKPEV